MRGWLISYINIYHLFAGSQCITSFSLQFVLAGWRNLAEVSSIILTTQDHWSVPSSMSKTLLQTEKAFTVKEYKHTHTRACAIFIKSNFRWIFYDKNLPFLMQQIQQIVTQKKKLLLILLRSTLKELTILTRKNLFCRIQYKNSLKYKVECFWHFSYVYIIN